MAGYMPSAHHNCINRLNFLYFKMQHRILHQQLTICFRLCSNFMSSGIREGVFSDTFSSPHAFCTSPIQEDTKDHFWHDHFDFQYRGVPLVPFIPLKGLLAPFCHAQWQKILPRPLELKPRKGNPSDLNIKVDVSKVDVKGFPKDGA